MARTVRVGRPAKPARLRKTRRLQMLLTISEHKRLAKFAQDRGTSVSELMRTQIRALLGQAEE